MTHFSGSFSLIPRHDAGLVDIRREILSFCDLDSVDTFSMSKEKVLGFMRRHKHGNNCEKRAFLYTSPWHTKKLCLGRSHSAVTAVTRSFALPSDCVLTWPLSQFLFSCCDVLFCLLEHHMCIGKKSRFFWGGGEAHLQLMISA